MSYTLCSLLKAYLNLRRNVAHTSLSVVLAGWRLGRTELQQGHLEGVPFEVALLVSARDRLRGATQVLHLGQKTRICALWKDHRGLAS